MLGLHALLRIRGSKRLFHIPSLQVLIKHFADSLVNEIQANLVDGASLVTHAVLAKYLGDQCRKYASIYQLHILILKI